MLVLTGRLEIKMIHGREARDSRAEHRRARELLIQSRELLKQIRADCFTVHGVHPTVSLPVLR